MRIDEYSRADTEPDLRLAIQCTFQIAMAKPKSTSNMTKEKIGCPSTVSGRKVEESDEQTDEHRTEDCGNHNHSQERPYLPAHHEQQWPQRIKIVN
jgi:hypothetical protein